MRIALSIVAGTDHDVHDAGIGANCWCDDRKVGQAVKTGIKKAPCRCRRPDKAHRKLTYVEYSRRNNTMSSCPDVTNYQERYDRQMQPIDHERVTADKIMDEIDKLQTELEQLGREQEELTKLFTELRFFDFGLRDTVQNAYEKKICQRQELIEGMQMNLRGMGVVA